MGIVHRFEVLPKVGNGLIDSRGESIRRPLETDHSISIGCIRSTLGYLVKGNFTEDEKNHAARTLFSDPIMEDVSVDTSFLTSSIFETDPEISILIGFKPGVTDNRAQAALDGLTTLFPNHNEMAVSTTIAYHFWDVPSSVNIDWLVGQLCNPLIERSKSIDRRENQDLAWPSLEFPERPNLEKSVPSIIKFR